MKTRAALLPTPGDPFVLRFWLDAFDRRWEREVDRLYVDLNTPSWLPEVVAEACFELVDGGDRYTPSSCTIGQAMTNHGEAISRMLDSCEEELVLLCEDDAPIINSSFVRNSFDIIDRHECDVLGSPRTSCSKAIWDATAAKYDLSGQPAADQGPSLWPCMLFASAADLRRTDKNFAAKGWAVGERIEDLNLVAAEPLGGDTFVWASIQLRALGLKIGYVPQYHSHPHDLDYHKHKTYLFDQTNPPTHFHIGSLSTLVGTAPDQCMFAEPAEFTAYLHRLKVQVDACNSTKQEMLRRYAWVELIHHTTRGRVDPMLGDEMASRYAANLAEVLRVLRLDRIKMDMLTIAYKELITW